MSRHLSSDSKKLSFNPKGHAQKPYTPQRHVYTTAQSQKYKWEKPETAELLASCISKPAVTDTAPRGGKKDAGAWSQTSCETASEAVAGGDDATSSTPKHDLQGREIENFEPEYYFLSSYPPQPRSIFYLFFLFCLGPIPSPARRTFTCPICKVPL